MAKGVLAQFDDGTATYVDLVERTWQLRPAVGLAGLTARTDWTGHTDDSVQGIELLHDIAGATLPLTVDAIDADADRAIGHMDVHVTGGALGGIPWWAVVLGFVLVAKRKR